MFHTIHQYHRVGQLLLAIFELLKHKKICFMPLVVAVFAIVAVEG
jgi:hypothetical protein